MNYLEVYAIKVEQPLCAFYITSIKANDLLKISFSEQLEYVDEAGKLHGSQRKINAKRLSEIGRYIDSVEMSFPNSIILAANYTEDGEIIYDESKRWDIQLMDNNLFKIIIPTDAKLAAIIDGQHRLKGFGESYITNMERLNVDLPCSIFFDLPNSYQAFLFATINGNQQKVDKSLALEQFGFNVEDEPQTSWTPEKLAVYFTRRLNFKDSPLKGHIKIAPKVNSELKKIIDIKEGMWIISTATIVDGIMNLFSSKPKRDRVEMAQEDIWGKRTRNMVVKFTDNSPLRKLYLNKEDETIFTIVFNYLEACNSTVWKEFDPKSYIYKTVGIQALFDLLKRILEKNIIYKTSEFIPFLVPALEYDFSNDSIQASGIGRRDIRNILLYSAGLISTSDLKNDDLRKIKSIQKYK